MNRHRIGIPEKWLHRAFVATLAFKAIFAVAETVAGIGAFFVDQGTIVALARAVTREELLEDPKDLLANYLLHAAQHLSFSSERFIGIYLTTHGVVKLALVAALLMRWLRAYPLAIAVFAIFIAYQAYRYTLTAAPSLIFLTAVDLVVIALTWHEYRYLRRMPGGRRRARA